MPEGCEKPIRFFFVFISSPPEIRDFLTIVHTPSLAGVVRALAAVSYLDSLSRSC